MRTAPRTKNPIHARSLLLLAALLLVLLPARSALAQRVLTEARVVELVRAEGIGALQGRARHAAADATERGAGALPNPSVSWQRETLADGGPVQDVVQLTVPLSLARPSAERALAASEGEQLRVEAEEALSSSMGRALAAYLDVVVAEGRVQLLQQELASLEEAARVLEKRSETGSASGYERSRLTLEVGQGRTRLASEQAHAQATRAGLAALLNLPSPHFRVEQKLELASFSGVEELVARALASRRQITHAKRSLDRATDARSSAAWLWVPDVAVSGGLNMVQEGERRYGYTAGVAIGLPVFGRGQDVKARADAQVALASARVSVLEREIRTQISEAYAMLESVRAELQRFRSATKPQAGVMLKAARTGYREGERSVVELLDAERAFAQVEQTELNLLATGKQAELQLRMVTGQW